MDVQIRPTVCVTVTVDELQELSACSRRMVQYADPNGSCLITRLSGQDGTPVKLLLARECLEAAAKTPFDTS